MIGPLKAAATDNRIIRVAVPPPKYLSEEAGTMTTGRALLNHNGVAQFMPLVIVTVNGMTNKTTCRTVVDYGDGQFVDIDQDEDDEEGRSNHHQQQPVDDRERLKLSRGSHAFVRCYGESFLRCTLESFHFSCAGGHPLLANFSQVLMAGEIEVDDEGKLTRWLNKSGLYMPPRFMIGQAGLPFELAWVYMSHEDVMALGDETREKLIDSGSLINISTNGTSMISNNAMAGRTPPRTPNNRKINVADKATLEINSSKLITDFPTTTTTTTNEELSSPPSTTLGGSSIHAMDTWIVKASDDLVWRPTISSVSYQAAKESVARFHQLKHRARRRIRRLRQRGNQVMPSSFHTTNGSHQSSGTSDRFPFPQVNTQSPSSKKRAEDIWNSTAHLRVSSSPVGGGVVVGGIGGGEMIGGGGGGRNMNGLGSQIGVREVSSSSSITDSHHPFDDEAKFGEDDSRSSVSYDADEERKVRAKVKAIERELKAAGVFHIHKQGAAERSKHKKDLGFSRTMELKETS
jgi:hypothetical protein